jgi:hypothetical protein
MHIDGVIAFNSICESKKSRRQNGERDRERAREGNKNREKWTTHCCQGKAKEVDFAMQMSLASAR